MGIAIRACGKIIVACDALEAPKLAELQSRAAANGVTGIEWLDQADIARLEPAVSARAALWSRGTGIVDSHGLMAALLADFETSGGVFASRSALAGVTRQADGSFGLRLDGSDTIVLTRHVVNSAGLGAVAVARGIEGMPPDAVPRLRYAKGHYFALSGAAPFQRLVYPVPVEGGLGVHATLDLGGRVRFGPDVEWVDSESFDVDASRAADFYGAIRRYWPGLPDGHLLPGYAGIRPKISGPGEPAADFRIDDARTHGIPGLVSLFGIESPGLTASMAIAELVAERLV